MIENDVYLGLPPGVSDKLKKKAETLTTTRGADYGHPLDDFSRTELIFRALADCPDPAVRVALMMIGVKLSRLVNSPAHEDSIDDIIGYAETIRMIHSERARRLGLSVSQFSVPEDEQLPHDEDFSSSEGTGEGSGERSVETVSFQNVACLAVMTAADVISCSACGIDWLKESEKVPACPVGRRRLDWQQPRAKTSRKGTTSAPDASS